MKHLRLIYTIISSLAIVAIIALLIYLITTSFHILKKDAIQHEDQRTQIIDSIERSQAHVIETMRDSLKFFSDSLNALRSENTTQVITRFNTIYDVDTIIEEKVVVDVEQLRQANECKLRLDSSRVAVTFLDSALSLCDSSKVILKDQRDDYIQLDKLWTQHYDLKFYQCIKKRRKIKKINKIKTSIEKVDN